MANPRVARNAYQRLYDMILSHGVTEYTRQHERYAHYRLFDDPVDNGRDARVRPRRAAHAPRPQHQVGRLRLRHGEAHPAAAARAGGLLEVHHRAPPEEGHRAVLGTAGRGALHVRLEAGSQPIDRARRPCSGARCTRTRCTSSPSRARTRCTPRSTGGSRPATTGSSITGIALPLLPEDLPGLPHPVRRELGEAHPARRRQAPHPVREGPRRHRHLPAQGREEPGLDRADGRPQLPQDRGVRLRLRSPRLQLRRRAQHREPRHHRVHRDPEARRRLPLRPAGRVAGAQDQAQEVPADGHRRGHPRSHQRARVPEAPEQRAHGSVPRPDGQDRHPVQHAPGRTRSRSTPATSTTGRSRASTSRPTPSRWGRCGRC